MNKQSMEEVSGALDGELDADGRALLARFDAMDGAAARDAWTRYALIGDALRGNPTPDDGFTLRILARLQNETARD